jgi:hypothetical protein
MFSAFKSFLKLMRLYYYVGTARMAILTWASGSEGARSISWGGPHVMSRGDRREAIFDEGEDRERFLMALAHGKNSSDWAGRKTRQMRSLHPKPGGVEMAVMQRTGSSAVRKRWPIIPKWEDRQVCLITC